MKKCELCDSPAKMYCESDQASLCWNCDSKVHNANFLVAKHLRTLLCNLCQSITPWTASGPKLTPTASLCINCVPESTCREETQNGHRKNNDDDENDDDREDDSDDDNAGGSENGDGGGNDDDEENQVVPWSSPAPPPASCSSNSDQESYGLVSNNNRDEYSSVPKIAYSVSKQNRPDFLDRKWISKPVKKNQKRGLQKKAGGVVNDNFE